MLAKTLSSAVVGLESELVEVEAHIDYGKQSVAIVGLPDAAIVEAKERVRAAIRNSGFTFPQRRLTVNLAPADLRKEGASYDLAIAIAVLSAMGEIEAEQIKGRLFLGELAFDGSLRPTNGMLPMASIARERGLREVFCPEANAGEAALVTGIDVVPIDSLAQLFVTFRGCLRFPYTKEHSVETDFRRSSTAATCLRYGARNTSSGPRGGRGGSAQRAVERAARFG